MRNRTIYHLPRKEWSKIVRFNSKDYLLRSLYDGEGDIEADERPASVPDRLIAPNVFREVPWYTAVHRRPRRLTEDIFDDMDDVNDIIDQAREEERYNPENFLYYIILDDGSTKGIQLSSDSTKNAAFYILSNYIILSDSLLEQDPLTVDEIMWAYGQMGKIMSYRMGISGIKYKDGAYRLILDTKNNTGDLQIYAIDDNDANFKINLPRVNNHRPFNNSVFTYTQFCNLLKCDRISLDPKTVTEFYEPIMQNMMSLFMENNVKVTLCRRKDNVIVKEDFFGHSLMEYPNKSFIARYFKPVARYENNPNMDFSKIVNLVQTVDIKDVYNGGLDNNLYSDDEYYVLIGGNDAYVKNIMSSAWASQCFNYKKFIYVIFEMQDPKLRTNVIRHDMVLMPLSRFILMSPGLITHLF